MFRPSIQAPTFLKPRAAYSSSVPVVPGRCRTFSESYGHDPAQARSIAPMSIRPIVIIAPKALCAAARSLAVLTFCISFSPGWHSPSGVVDGFLAQLPANDQFESGPDLADRTDLDVDEPQRQRQLANDVLGDGRGRCPSEGRRSSRAPRPPEATRAAKGSPWARRATGRGSMARSRVSWRAGCPSSRPPTA